MLPQIWHIRLTFNCRQGAFAGVWAEEVSNSYRRFLRYLVRAGFHGITSSPAIASTAVCCENCGTTADCFSAGRESIPDEILVFGGDAVATSPVNQDYRVCSLSAKVDNGALLQWRSSFDSSFVVRCVASLTSILWDCSRRVLYFF